MTAEHETVYTSTDPIEAELLEDFLQQNGLSPRLIGTRNALRALLMAMLEPVEKLRAFERSSDFTSRLALLEELKGLPFGAVWDTYCLQNDVPVGFSFMEEIEHYEKTELSKRR